MVFHHCETDGVGTGEAAVTERRKSEKTAFYAGVKRPSQNTETKISIAAVIGEVAREIALSLLTEADKIGEVLIHYVQATLQQLNPPKRPRVL